MNLHYNGQKIICQLKFKDGQSNIWVEKVKIPKLEFWRQQGIALDFLQSLVWIQVLKLMLNRFWLKLFLTIYFLEELLQNSKKLINVLKKCITFYGLNFISKEFVVAYYGHFLKEKDKLW